MRTPICRVSRCAGTGVRPSAAGRAAPRRPQAARPCRSRPPAPRARSSPGRTPRHRRAASQGRAPTTRASARTRIHARQPRVPATVVRSAEARDSPSTITSVMGSAEGPSVRRVRPVGRSRRSHRSGCGCRTRRASVDGLDHPNDLEPELGRRARLGAGPDRRRRSRPSRAESGSAASTARRDDVAGAVGELVLAERLRVAERHAGVEDPHRLGARVVVDDHLARSRRSSSAAACSARATRARRGRSCPTRYSRLMNATSGIVREDAAAAHRGRRATASRRASSGGSRSRAARGPRRR